ncbi:DHH family phosphoesterase [Butyrivibrio sp. NC2002]|uniref:DHH family phosphoesterase n=1 Tax=Butyrivibrio sp. NC2002 TaxID=1410610 RepID=UPI00055BF282|nr:DHH family phosphoesterase [Butyrivibrio sp. NC2002]
MKLGELLKFNHIVIQCHDNPDADALASGYGLYSFFAEKGKDVRFIYRGKNKIKKSNLLIMIDELAIPVEYAPDFDEVPELLITVDCQYGQRNVTYTKAQNIAVIDHHQKTVSLPEFSEVKSNVGSASTVVWNLIKKEGMQHIIDRNRELSTALYYGLYTDTGKLSEVSHPLDRDMLDELIINKSLIITMSNSNISLNELKITGKAILGYEYFPKNRYLIIEAEPCDPNILGVMSDFSLETEGVDVCLAFYSSPSEIKYSVRSCTKEVHANELAEYIAQNIGGGGGHIFKAGGTIFHEKIESQKPQNIIKQRLESYYRSYDIIYAEETTLDTSNMQKYKKLPQDRGYVKLAEVFPEDTPVFIRTLEGDVDISVAKDLYVMIGIEGEIYPISEEKFAKSYIPKDMPFEADYDYPPNIKNKSTGEKKNIMSYAKVASTTDSSFIYASKLKKGVKVFTAWDKEKYYLGNAGDYIASRSDDPHDIYVIKEKIFEQSYEKVL